MLNGYIRKLLGDCGDFRFRKCVRRFSRCRDPITEIISITFCNDITRIRGISLKLNVTQLMPISANKSETDICWRMGNDILHEFVSGPLR